MPPKKMRQKQRTNANSQQKQLQRSKPRVPTSIVNRLDEQARCYAALLANPCDAPLCHPTYSGADGALVVRVESYYYLGVTTGATASAFAWTPGAIGGNGTLGASITTFDAIDANTLTTLVAVANFTQPGYTFLAANASEVRCAAACIQVVYPGTELNRSGIINYGNANGAVINRASQATVSQLQGVLPYYERTPTNCVEIRWRPTSFDQEMTSPTANTELNEIYRRGSLIVSQSGGYPSTGLCLRLVAVYEYTPLMTSGLVLSNMSRNTSANTLDHVINALDSTGSWMTRGAAALGSVVRGASKLVPYVRAIAYAGAKTGQLLLG